MRLQISGHLEAIGKVIIKGEKRFSFIAYLLHSKENILIDTLPDRSADMLLEALKDILGDAPLHAIIANHSEEDHSGSLPAVLKAYPDVPVYGTDNCRKRLGDKVPAKDFHVVHTDDVLTLGNYKFTFVETPGLHWDDNMVTLLTNENILFSNDLFGQAAAAEPCIDSAYNKEDLLKATATYYHKVFAAAPLEQKLVLKKIAALPLKMIAPGHGVILEQYKQAVIDFYLEQLKKA
jgi:flavorubredoxin